MNATAQRRWTIVAALAARDFMHERVMSFCVVFALAAIVAPLLVLFGLKNGLVGGLSEQLGQDARTREIRPLVQGGFDAEWFAALARQPEVYFLVPSIRFLSAQIVLRSVDGRTSATADLLPTGANDPLLAGDTPPPTGAGEIALSQATAERLRVAVGDMLEARVTRNAAGNIQSVPLALRVKEIVPLAKFDREGAFVSLALLSSIEDFREGRADAVDPAGTASADRKYASFRLYARTIYDVEALRDHLASLSVDTHTMLPAIAMFRRLDRGLNLLFAIVASLSVAGFAVSLAANLRAGVERKRRELAILRLIGFSGRAMALFPAVYATIAAGLGVAAAFAAYLPASFAINALPGLELGGAQVACRLAPIHYVFAALGVLAVGLASATMAAQRAAAVSAAEGLRHD